jgi:adenine-specific DNA-methyltransferase
VTLLTSHARDLGARGSRGEVASADPAGDLPAQAAAVLAAIPAWWEARAREVGLTGLWLDVTSAVLAPPPAVAIDGSVLPSTLVPTSATGAEVGTAYVTSLSSAVRARHGRHYTPPDLAAHLWQMTRKALRLGPHASTLPGLIRDHACGAGALLLPAVREHVRANVRTEPALALAALPNLVEGIDADPAAVWLASVVLAAETLPLVAAIPASRRHPLPALARCGDGLEAQTRPSRASVINPPYGRVRLSPDERHRWSHVLYGHANLYGLFMAAALEALDEKGVLAALVPTSFTSGLYFSRLRETLAVQAPLRETAFVASRDGVFADVLQETCLAVFDRRKARRTTIYSVNGHVSEVARVAAPRGALPWLLPRRADDAPVAATAALLPLRLTQVGYRCSTGPLVWNRRAADLGSAKRKGTLPVLWAADIDGGTLHRDRRRDGLRYLRLSGNDDQVLTLGEPAVLVQRTTSPEQTRRLVAAELTDEDLQAWGGRVVVENHVNVLRPTVEWPLLSLRTLTAVLASDALDRVMRSLSGSVAVSAYELEAMPLPAPEILAAWDDLEGEALRAAISAAYRGAS